MSDLLLGALGYCHFHYYIHCWCDFTPCVDLSWSSLFLRIFIVLLSSSSLVLIYPLRFTLLFFSYTNLFQVWYFPCIILAYLIISLICFIVSLLILHSHWAPSSPWLTSFSIHVAFYTWGHEFFYHWVFGHSFPSFLLPYHPNLHHFSCLKTTLRP